jgi:hypothetical protein
MDLHTADRVNGQLWSWVRLGAFLCFLIAGGLLAAALFSPLAGDFPADSRVPGSPTSAR